jgi:hypothetical protein
LPNDHLYAVAQEILSTAVDILGDADLEVPERQFVTFGEVADDCDLIAVSWQALYVGEPGAPNLQPEGLGFVTRSSSFEVRRIKCISSSDERGTPPSAAEMNEDAEAILTDLWTLYQGFVARKGDKTFLEGCQGFAIGNALPVGPTGGIGGFVLPLEVQVL